MAAVESVPFTIVKRKPEPRVPGRRHHIIEHPVTDEERQEYEHLAARWKAAQHAFEVVVNEAIARGWGHLDYDGEPILDPLKPRHEIVYDETVQEWRDRIAPIIAG